MKNEKITGVALMKNELCVTSRLCVFAWGRKTAITILATFFIFNFSFFTSSAADYDIDCLNMSQRDISGTARYVGLGGAMTALGGDASAINDNPAALGLFRRWEVTATTDVSFGTGYSKWGLGEVGMVFSTDNSGMQKGVIYHNLAIQFSRNNQYNFTVPHEAWQGSTSQTDLMAERTNGRITNDFAYEPWNNSEIGWLSCFGVDNDLITETANEFWQSVRDPQKPVRGDFDKTVKGYSGSVNMAWGMNISNRWYVGLGVNIDYWSYNTTTNHNEQLPLLQSAGYQVLHYGMQTYESVSGVGISGSIGLIYRPLSWLRLGASYVSPSVLTFTEVNYVSGYSYFDNHAEYVSVYSPTNTYTSEGIVFSTPMRVTAGVAFQFGAKGLLSLEYDGQYQAKQLSPNMHWVKIGGEWVIRQHCFLRAGYAVASPLCKLDWQYIPEPISVKTATDYAIPRAEHYASVGIGYRTYWLEIEGAYQCRISQTTNAYYAGSSLTDQTALRHRIVLTLGFARLK